MEKIDIKITCDSCGADLSPYCDPYPHDYFLKVIMQDRILPHEGFIYDVLVHPPLEKDLHFCGLICMKNYKFKDEESIKKYTYEINSK